MQRSYSMRDAYESIYEKKEEDTKDWPSIKDAKERKKTNVKHYKGLGIAPTIKEAIDILVDNGLIDEEERLELDERTRYAKETGKDFKTGKPSVEGGEGRSEAGKYMQKMMRATGGAMSSRGKAIQPQGKKKERGAKSKFKKEPTPVDKIKAKLSRERAPKPNPYKARAGESD